MPEVEIDSFKVEDMHLTARLNSGVDLDEIVATFPQATLDSRLIPVVQFRIYKESTINLCQNGKLICYGVRSFTDAKNAIRRFIELLQQHQEFEHIDLIQEPQRTNVVATVKIEKRLPLELLRPVLDIEIHDPLTYPCLTFDEEPPVFADTRCFFITDVESDEHLKDCFEQIWKGTTPFFQTT